MPPRQCRHGASLSTSTPRYRKRAVASPHAMCAPKVKLTGVDRYLHVGAQQCAMEAVLAACWDTAPVIQARRLQVQDADPRRRPSLRPGRAACALQLRRAERRGARQATRVEAAVAWARCSACVLVVHGVCNLPRGWEVHRHRRCVWRGLADAFVPAPGVRRLRGHAWLQPITQGCRRQPSPPRARAHLRGDHAAAPLDGGGEVLRGLHELGHSDGAHQQHRHHDGLGNELWVMGGGHARERDHWARTDASSRCDLRRCSASGSLPVSRQRVQRKPPPPHHPRPAGAAAVGQVLINVVLGGLLVESVGHHGLIVQLTGRLITRKRTDADSVGGQAHEQGSLTRVWRARQRVLAAQEVWRAAPWRPPPRSGARG